MKTVTVPLPSQSHDAMVLSIIDRRIAEAEIKLGDLKRAAELIPIISTNLAALRRTRAILAGEPETVMSNGDQIAAREATAARNLNVHIESAAPSEPPTIGRIAIELLSEAKRPMRVKELVTLIHARGSTADEPTIVGALSRLVKREQLVRPFTSTYAMPPGVTVQFRPDNDDFVGTALEVQKN